MHKGGSDVGVACIVGVRNHFHLPHVQNPETLLKPTTLYVHVYPTTEESKVLRLESIFIIVIMLCFDSNTKAKYTYGKRTLNPIFCV